MKKIVLATRNSGKIQEIRELFRDLDLEVIPLLDLLAVPEVEEDGSTFRENALKKARHVFSYAKLPSIADDSGLEVYSLSLGPGVLSARYAGAGVDYAANNRKLLEALKKFSPEDRGARFRCVAAFVDSDVEKITEGVCEGTIIMNPRGSGGFGYDPLFVPKGYDETFAELSMGVKNQISHRGTAFRIMKQFLRTHLKL